MIKIRRLLNWLNNGNRWHDLGHILSGFFLCSVSMTFLSVNTTILLMLVGVIIKEVFIDGIRNKTKTIKDTTEWLIGIILALLI